MPRVSPEHEERRRHQILQAALACFARRGYHRTTVDEIVATAGLSKGALYQYFKGKEDLFLALHRLQEGELRRRVENAFAGEESVKEKLERGAEVFLSSLQAEYGDFARIGLEFWAEAPRRPDLGEKFREGYTEWQAFLSRVIARGVRSGEFRADLNCEALASAILGVCDGLTLHRVIHGELFDPKEVQAVFLSSLLRGIAAKGRPSRSRRKK